MNPINVVVTILLGLSMAASASPFRCMGGEGPKPLSDISGLLNYKVKPVDTPATLQEFFIWENKNTLVYRDVSGDIRTLSIAKNTPTPSKEYVITKLSQPLSRITDSSERYLTSLGDRIWVYDTWTSGWNNAVQKKNVEPLFWTENAKRNYLVSHSVTSTGTTQTHEFYSTVAGSSSQTPICTFTQNNQNPLRGARGAADPYYYFWGEMEVDGKRLVTLHPLNVFTCRFEKGVIYEGVRHPVQEIIYFKNLNAIAMKLDNDKQNLLWWSPKGCDYYDIGRVSPMVPNFKLPVLMTWTPEHSIQLIYPEKAERVELLKGLPIQSLEEKDVWLNKDANRLFLASKLEDDNQRWLMEMEIGKRVPNQELIARRDQR